VIPPDIALRPALPRQSRRAIRNPLGGFVLIKSKKMIFQGRWHSPKISILDAVQADLAERFRELRKLRDKLLSKWRPRIASNTVLTFT
jgi:hypothetical protein